MYSGVQVLRDVLDTPRQGWSLTKIRIAFRGLLFGWLIHFLFSYAALFIAVSFSPAGLIAQLQHYEFAPPLVLGAGILPLAVSLLGAAAALYIIIVHAVAIARCSYEYAGGKTVFPRKKALSHGWRAGPGVIGALAGIVGLAVLLLAPAAVFGFVARLPEWGHVIYGLTFVVQMLAAVPAALLVYCVVFGSCMAAAICGCRESDVCEIGVETILTLLRKPLQYLAHEIVGTVMIAVSLVLLTAAYIAAFTLVVWISGYASHSIVSEIVTVSWYRIPGLYNAEWFFLLETALESLTGIMLTVPLAEVTPALRIGGWLMGIVHMAALLGIASYLFSALMSLQVTVYRILYHRRTGRYLVASSASADATSSA